MKKNNRHRVNNNQHRKCFVFIIIITIIPSSSIQLHLLLFHCLFCGKLRVYQYLVGQQKLSGRLNKDLNSAPGATMKS